MFWKKKARKKLYFLKLLFFCNNSQVQLLLNTRVVSFKLLGIRLFSFCTHMLRHCHNFFAIPEACQFKGREYSLLANRKKKKKVAE